MKIATSGAPWTKQLLNFPNKPGTDSILSSGPVFPVLAT